MKRPKPSAPPDPEARTPHNRWWRQPEPPPAAPSRNGEPWSKEDDRILRRNYTRNGSKYAAALLGRTIAAVQTRAELLGIPGYEVRAWTEIEDKHLRRKYATHTAAQIARTLRRTEQSVRGRINHLGIGGERAPKWTAAEIEYLRKNYAKISIIRLAIHFGRTTEAVQIKAGRVGLTRSVLPFNPTARQMSYIVANLGTIPYSVMAAKFGVTVGTIQKIAEKNGYRDRPQSRPWTDEDLRRLRELYGTRTRAEVAAELDRTPVAVAERAAKLGITNRRVVPTEKRRWTPREIEFVRRHHGTMSNREIARRLKRTVPSIGGCIATLGIAGKKRANVETS